MRRIGLVLLPGLLLATLIVVTILSANSSDGETSQGFVGIGITVHRFDSGEIDIKTVIPNSPADETGLLAGDVIVAVDGVALENITLLDFHRSVKGEEGTEVELVIRRGNSAFEVTVVRGLVTLPHVEEYK